MASVGFEELSVLNPFDLSFQTGLDEATPLVAKAEAGAAPPPGSVQTAPPPTGQHRGRKFCQIVRDRVIPAGLSCCMLSAGVAMKVFNDELSKLASGGSSYSVKIDTIGNLILGVSTAMLSRCALPEALHVEFHNFVKRISAELEEILANIYLNVPQTTLTRQLYFTPVQGYAAETFVDDIVTLLRLHEGDLKQRPMQDTPLPMLEGDAKSTKRMLLNQAVILVMGVAMIVLGSTLKTDTKLGKTVTTTVRDAGVVTGSFALGSALAKFCFDRLETWHKEWRGAQNPESTQSLAPPKHLKVLNTMVSFFQVCFPIAIAITVTPNKPLTFGLTGAIWGVATYNAQRLFQYTSRVQQEPTEKSRWGRVASGVKWLWEKRKPEIAVTSIWTAILTGWTIWGEVDGGSARIRGAVAILSATTLGSTLLTSLLDFIYRPSASALENSFFFHLVVHCPATIAYLLIQTKLIASDSFITQTSPLGYIAALAALLSLGYALGQNRWMQTREGRTDPALTPKFTLAILFWILWNRFFGNIT